MNAWDIIDAAAHSQIWEGDTWENSLTHEEAVEWLSEIAAGKVTLSVYYDDVCGHYCPALLA